MFRPSRESEPRLPLSPVDALLSQVEEMDRKWPRDDFIYHVRCALTWAKHCNLSSQPIVQSCIDLAETYTTIPEVADRSQSKLDTWKRARETAMRVDRRPREISMELDPIYFESILRGSKTYEGRAYKPDSDKSYPDIRANDHIRFLLSSRMEKSAEEIARRELSPHADMTCTVKEIYFAPTAHGMYQIPRFNGLGFQPMIDGPSEMLQLQRAAVYHSFPGYHELISEHGFLGIQVESPQLVSAA